jgi:hypothetical protein
LSPGEHSYQISAAWQQDGRLVTQERTVTVSPGARMTVDFTQAQPERGEELQNRPDNPEH